MLKWKHFSHMSWKACCTIWHIPRTLWLTQGWVFYGRSKLSWNFTSFTFDTLNGYVWNLIQVKIHEET